MYALGAGDKDRGIVRNCIIKDIDINSKYIDSSLNSITN